MIGHVALFLEHLSHTTCPLSPHENRDTMTFITEQYVPSICPEPAAPELREQRHYENVISLLSVLQTRGCGISK